MEPEERSTPAVSRRCRVAMVGPARQVRGGISAVVSALIDAAPADGPAIRYIATHVDGTKTAKLLAALSGAARLVGAILFWRCRIVHLHMSSGASFVRKAVLATVARLLLRRVVVHVHGSEFDVFFERSSAVTKGAIRRVLESADLVVALSEVWRDRLERMAPSAHIRVLPNPVASIEYSEAAAGRADVPPGGGTILFLGAFNARKGIYDLVEAADRVAAERPRVLFELGGDQNVDEIRKLVEAKGRGDNFHIMGWVRGGQKLDAFSRAHLFVLPSYHEGVPIAILEALAAGLPIITTPVGGIPEVIEDGTNGLLVQPGDVDALAASMLRLLGDADLRRAIGAANTELARTRHDAGIVARTLLGWYEELLEQ